MSSVSYKTSCTRENLKNIRNFVEEAIMDMGLDEILNNQIILAVDEICANLIIHVHQTTPQDIIVIDILYLEDGVLFEIVDTKTTYFDFSKYQKPNLEDIKVSKRKGGMCSVLGLGLGQAKNLTINRVRSTTASTNGSSTNRLAVKFRR